MKDASKPGKKRWVLEADYIQNHVMTLRTRIMYDTLEPMKTTVKYRLILEEV